VVCHRENPHWLKIFLVEFVHHKFRNHLRLQLRSGFAKPWNVDVDACVSVIEPGASSERSWGAWLAPFHPFFMLGEQPLCFLKLRHKLHLGALAILVDIKEVENSLGVFLVEFSTEPL